MKRIHFVLVAFFIFSLNLFAATYKIADYEFFVTGKTKPSSLEDIVGKPGTSFESIEKLIEFLNEKKQDLMNMRLFSDVDYKYKVSSENPTGFFNIDVSFYVFDASSIFILPYPKYDSNYGLKFGVKAYNKNLGGRFTNLYSYFGFTQRDHTFKEGSYDWELSMDDIDLGVMSGAISHTGLIDLYAWDKSYLALNASLADIVIKDFEAAVALSFKFSPKGVAKDSKWALKVISGAFNFKFRNGAMDNFSFYNDVTYLPLKNEVDTSTRMSYRMDYEIYNQTVFRTVMIDKPGDVNRNLDRIELGSGISRAFPLTRKISVNTSFMFYVQYDYTKDIVTSNFDLGFTSSHSGINWQGNFRRGVSYDLGFDLLTFPINETDRTSFKVNGSISGFLPVTSWFNPSARVTFTISDRLQYFRLSGSEAVADYARGIRLDNEVVDTEIAPMRKFTLALNFDMMFNFITIENFCHSYAIPFADVIIASKGNYGQGFDCLWTVGADGVVILDNHPGYPIRGSVGFNGKDLIDLAKGKIGLSELEFEIFIGMGFFY